MDSAEDATVPVALVVVEADRLASDERGEMDAAFGTVGLCQLGRVNVGQPDTNK